MFAPDGFVVLTTPAIIAAAIAVVGAIGVAGAAGFAIGHDGASVEWPRDYQLTFRGVLGKTIRQPFFHPYGISDGSDRADVWHVLENGSNLDAVVEDVVETVLAQAVPFIDCLDDPRQAMQSLLHEEGRNAGFGSLGILSAGRGSAQHIQDADRLRALLG